ncbi:MAG TPA: hypothetical protein VJ400_01425 [Thermoplasmata archaeon]|nr:hypothetical protein [Thermoplasmata archaeon]
METVKWADIPMDVRVQVIQELGYVVKDEVICDSTGSPVMDRYTRVPVRFDNLLIVWGSDLLLDNNPISIASYFEEYGELL